MWLRLDEHTDVLLSLDACLRSLHLTKSLPGNWKWAILSLHNALQGSMVCHLNGSAALGALTKKSAGAWLEWYEQDRRGEINRIEQELSISGVRNFEFASKADKPPLARLADASELFRRLGDEQSRLEAGVGGVLVPDPAEQSAFHQVHRHRNTFTHFQPMGWSLALDELPGHFLALMGLLERIAADPYPFRHMTPDQKAEQRSLLADMRVVLLDMAR